MVYAMVSPWCNRGTILQCALDLAQRNQRVPIKRWLLEVIKGLSHLHSLDLFHLDLRSSNVLIDDDLYVKLADFGLANSYNRMHSVNDAIYSKADAWQAPEVLKNYSITPRTSQYIYSFAIFCMEFFSTRRPNGGPAFNTAAGDFDDIKPYIIDGARPVRPRNTDHDLSDELWELLEECWDGDPTRRPPLKIIQSRFLAAEVPSSVTPDVVYKSYSSEAIS